MKFVFLLLSIHPSLSTIVGFGGNGLFFLPPVVGAHPVAEAGLQFGITGMRLHTGLL